MTQPVQPMTDLQYPFALNQPFSLTIGTEEKQCGFLCPSVSQPKLWNNSWCGWHSPHSTTGVHVHEQQQKIIQGLDKSHKPLHITWYLGLRQATSLREQTEQADGGIPFPWERVSSYYCLLLSFDADFISGLAALALICSFLLSQSTRAMKPFWSCGSVSFSSHFFSRAKSVNLQVWVWFFSHLCIF